MPGFFVRDAGRLDDLNHAFALTAKPTMNIRTSPSVTAVAVMRKGLFNIIRFIVSPKLSLWNLPPIDLQSTKIERASLQTEQHENLA